MRLQVELYGQIIGQLGGDARTFDFEPNSTATEVFGSTSRVLSVAIPLVKSQNRAHSARRRNFFEELLPEGEQLDFMLAMGGLRRDDPLAFLARYGRDVAGALQIWDADDPSEPQTPAIRPVTNEQIEHLLNSRSTSPLANTGPEGKTSLAGVQPKIVLAYSDGSWHQVLGGYPSTHILKPAVESRPTEIFDEEYGSRFMRALNVAEFSTSLDTFGGTDALIIERFDRDPGAPGARVHQEDFNQALGANGIEEYQKYGGRVSLKRIAAVLRSHGSPGDVQKLAAIVTASVAIANLDMHAKNLGLLHPIRGGIRLAPAYDFVPHGLRDGLDGEMALSINKEYQHAAITKADLMEELASWGIRIPGGKIINETLEQIRETAKTETPSGKASTGIDEQINRTTQNLLDGQPAVSRAEAIIPLARE